MRTFPFQGKDVEVDSVRFQPVQEQWNEYELEDGSRIRARLIAAEVLRVRDAYDKEGNPIYILRSQNFVHVEAADQLRRRSGEER